MADWVNRARDGEVFQIQNLATAEENDRICRGFLEDLRSNKVVRTLNLDHSPCFGSVKSSKVLGEVVGSSTALQELSLCAVGMNGDGLEYIIRGLLSNRNSALAYLNLSLNTRLGTKGAKLVEELLLGNIPTLKSLAIFGTGFTPEDTAPVARALAKNQTLHELGCGRGYGIIQPDRDGPLSSILKALTPVEQASDQEGKSNSTLQILTMTYEYERGIAENLGRMLSRNSSLQALSLWNFQFNREEWAGIWKVLRHNKRLKILDLSGCGKGLGDAFVDLMDLLEANGTIIEIRMVETQLETTGQSVLVKQQLARNKKLAEIHLEEFKEIMGRLQSKSWNWKDVSDSKAVANVGRELGKWVISASSAAVVTVENIFMALKSLLEIMQKLRVHLQHQVAKSIFQDVVRKLTDQINPMFEDICIYILLEYCQMCNWTGDFQELVECCKRGITLTAGSQKDFARFHFHYFLGLGYINLLDAPQAEKELRDARNSMPTDLEVSKKFKNILVTNTNVQNLVPLLEAAEGRLALLQLGSSAGMSSKYGEEALDKLLNSLEGLTIICESQNATLVDEKNWIEVALNLSQVMSYNAKGQSNALHVCEMALQNAKKLQISPILVGRAAIQCGGLAATVGKYEEAERYIGEGLAELDKLQCDEPLLSANLYHVLGKLLQSRGGSHLPKAEEALRQAIKTLSEVLNKGTLTSEFRIQAFEMHKQYFSSLQSCLCAIYMQAEENQRRRIAREALVVAEQGRCRDLMLNLRETFMSRIPDNKELFGDDNVGLMDWKKFDTDGEYAWRHLEKCIAICTDVIKEQNPEVKRVTFVEYSLTDTQMLIWVLHSNGTEEPGGAQTPSTLLSMYSVDVKEAFQESVMEDSPDFKEYFERDFQRDFQPRELQSKYDRRLLETQTLQAVKLFEFYIEKLLSDPEPQKRLLTQLYMLLIKPIDIADNLVDGEPLIFIPHEALSFVPYAALLPKGGKHLIENHPIGAAYSLRALGWATKQCIALNARRATSDINRVLLVADPLPLGVDKDSLEDSIEEVTKIATMLPQYSPKLLVREGASLETVVSHMKTTSWYHIACHGEVTSQYPQGVLFLGKADMNEDATRSSESSEPSEQHRLGFLTPEIIAKDLGSVTARAAVLSACKVGRGKKTGEGLLGLSRAFMQAGVPLVIAPLRTVGSRLCSAFMQHLYKKLVEGESVMFALRSTMVDVIKKRVEVVAAKHEDDDDDDDDEKWQVWDWAAWLAVGFPGVCLTSLTTPNVNDLEQNEGKLVIYNEDRAPTVHAESLSEYKNPSSHEKAFYSDSDLVQNGARDYLLDKSNERSCLRIGARELTIIWGDDTRYWDWVRSEDSIFKEVAHLKLVWWLEAKGKLLSSLYPGTYTLSWRLRYSSSFIDPRNRSLVDCYIDPMFSLEVTGNEPVITQWRITANDTSVLLHHCAGRQQLLEWRWDTSGWMEVDVGEFSVASKDSPVEVNFSMKETDNKKCKSGLYLDGIVIRPSSLTPKYQGASGLGDLQVSRKDVDRLDDNGVSVGSKSALGADGGTANGEAILGKPAQPEEDHARSQLEEARGEINASKGFNARLENALEASRRTCEQLRHEHRRTVAELERVRKEKTVLEAEKVNFQEQVMKAQANVQDENVVVASVKAGSQQFTT